MKKWEIELENKLRHNRVLETQILMNRCNQLCVCVRLFMFVFVWVCIYFSSPSCNLDVFFPPIPQAGCGTSLLIPALWRSRENHYTMGYCKP